MKKLKSFEFLNKFISLLWIIFVVTLTIALNYTQLLSFLSWYIYANDIDIFRNLETQQTSYKKDLVMFSDSIVEKDYLPEGVQIIMVGTPKVIQTEIEYISKKHSKKLISQPKHLVISYPQAQVLLKGVKTEEEFKNIMQDEIRTIFDAINNDDREILIQKFKDYKPEKELPKNLREFSINITNLDIKKEKIIDSSFANLDLSMGACKKDASLRVYFDKKLEKFTFSNYENFVDNLCLKSGILGFIFGESCEDCTFYPLDRYNSLPNIAWEPSDIVYVQEIPGGQSISMKAYNDLIDMFREAQKAGFSMMLNSGYRSYQTQYYVYENWVKVEMSKGYTRSQAEAIASQYSARPGFSEHQLGTTVDIGAVSCSSFTNCNESIWNWLRDNAYKFGFIMSYPPGTQNKTGYIHEPWHYRWIGRDLASEYILYKDQYVLGEWLKLKNVGIL